MTAFLAASDPVTAAQESYRGVNAYSVTLRSKSQRSEEVIKYHYKKPGFVRMEFVRPHGGALLVYDPHTNEARLRPFKSMRFFVMTLSPQDRLIRSSSGHTVDDSDIGALLERVRELKDKGALEVVGDEKVGNREAAVVSVEGKGGATVDGIGKYLLWLEKGSSLPLKVVAYDGQGRLSEEVLMDDLVIDPEFPAGFFSLG